MDPESTFGSVIMIKTNIAAVLANEVGRRSWRREMVAIGTATDPYQPAEGTYRLTRQAIEVLARFKTPASIVTKGTLIVRDVDVLQNLDRRAGVTVCHSIPTTDIDIWRKSEPGTPAPRHRLAALRGLRDSGIRAGVLLAPLMPGLSARPEIMRETVRAAVDHGASFVWANVLHLGPHVRDTFMTFLAREFPDLLKDYETNYSGKYAPPGLSKPILGSVKDSLREFNLENRYLVYRTELASIPRQLILPL